MDDFAGRHVELLMKEWWLYVGLPRPHFDARLKAPLGTGQCHCEWLPGL